MIFECLEPWKMNPRAGGNMILMFCPSPEKGSIFIVFWYLLLELLESPTLENIVLRGAWIFFTFYIDFYAILGPQNGPQIM